PTAGPSVVSWMAMTARRPAARSWTRMTSSWPIARASSRAVMKAPEYTLPSLSLEACGEGWPVPGRAARRPGPSLRRAAVGGAPLDAGRGAPQRPVPQGPHRQRRHERRPGPHGGGPGAQQPAERARPRAGVHPRDPRAEAPGAGPARDEDPRRAPARGGAGPPRAGGAPAGLRVERRRVRLRDAEAGRAAAGGLHAEGVHGRADPGGRPERAG